MAKYRKKPVVIEAAKFNGSSTSKAHIEAWMNGERGCPDGSGVHTRDIMGFTIKTLAGDMLTLPGDYIIKGVKGEFYPCAPDIFAQTYEPAPEGE